MFRKINFIALLMMAMVVFSCQNSQQSGMTESMDNGNHKGKVKEVIHTTSYTYLNLDENGSDVWIAVDKQEFREGDIVYYLEGLEMNDFKSEELGRTFETVHFIQDISDQPISAPQPTVMGSTEPLKPTLSKIDVSVEIPEGGTSIADLYANKEKFNGKMVTVRGKVTKVNTAIMDRNWIHIQDGTGDETKFDLTVTSDDNPEVGDIVTYWGTIGIEKDFGMGYYYELILEGAERLGN
ncbi:MAG: SH3-like domain-containing protein [Bacteroidales bacterium]|nr:SH3-like domain-containing protein [Bacteroidales bacterium]